jgi:hypothetical protein
MDADVPQRQGLGGLIQADATSPQTNDIGEIINHLRTK